MPDEGTRTTAKIAELGAVFQRWRDAKLSPFDHLEMLRGTDALVWCARGNAPDDVIDMAEYIECNNMLVRERKRIMSEAGRG